MKTVVVNSEGMGQGDAALARRLMIPFLEQLRRHDHVDALILYNAGVKLAAEGSDLVPSLSALHEKGVDVICCGTCVGHFGLEGKVRAGRVSHMEEIVKTLMAAEKTVTL